jgi:hypothetical protein
MTQNVACLLAGAEPTLADADPCSDPPARGPSADAYFERTREATQITVRQETLGGCLPLAVRR